LVLSTAVKRCAHATIYVATQHRRDKRSRLFAPADFPVCRDFNTKQSFKTIEYLSKEIS
jgi:hypothetical protein